MAEIRDPTILRELSGSPGEITDPKILRELNGETPLMKGVEAVGRHAAEVLPSIGRGILHGAAGIAGLPGDISNLVQDLFTKHVGREPTDVYGQPIKGRLPGSADIKEGASKAAQAVGLPGELFKPKTGTGQYSSAMAEGATSMLSGNPLLLALGGVSGAGGELANQLMPDTPGARLGGALLPMLAATPLAFKTPQIVKTLAESLLESGPAMGKAATGKAQADAALGMETLFSHQVPQNSGLAGVVREVAAAPEGAALRAKLLEEEARMLAKSEAFARSPTDLPVDVAAQSRVSKTGDALFAEAAGTRARASAPLYAKGDDQLLVSDLAKALLDETKAKPWAGGPRAKPLDQAARDLLSMAEAQGGGALTIPGKPAGKIVDEAGKPLIPGTPPMEIPATISAQATGDLANVNAVTGRGPVTADKLPYDRTSSVLTEAAQAGSPAQAAADMVYKTGSDWFVNPLKEGPVGQAFPKQAGTSQGPRPWRTMNKVLDNPQVSAEDVRTFAGHIIEQDAEAFPLLVKESWMRSGSDKTPGDFFNSIAGNADSVTGKVTREAFKEKVYQAHIAHGASEKEALEAAAGADNLATAVQTITKGHAGMAPGPQMGTKEIAKGNPVSTVAQVVHPSIWIRWLGGADMIEKSLSRKVMRDISEALVSPDALARLREISRYSPVENASKVVTRGLVSLGIQSED